MPKKEAKKKEKKEKEWNVSIGSLEYDIAALNGKLLNNTPPTHTHSPTPGSLSVSLGDPRLMETGPIRGRICIHFQGLPFDKPQTPFLAKPPPYQSSFLVLNFHGYLCKSDGN